MAIAVNALGFVLVKKRGIRSLSGQPITLVKKPMTRGLLLGAVLFGVGWALAGTCPGTALAQIGEGRLAGVVTFIGILGGALLERRLSEGRARRAKAIVADAAPAE